jgi:hypothetical protein
MKYIKKRYRAFYIPLIILVYIFTTCKIIMQFIIVGMIPEIDQGRINVSIEEIDGNYYKVYRQGLSRYIGEQINKSIENE